MLKSAINRDVNQLGGDPFQLKPFESRVSAFNFRQLVNQGVRVVQLVTRQISIPAVRV